MSFIEGLKAAIDQARGIPGKLGLRPFPVLIRVRSWSGARAGLGTATDTDTDLLRVGEKPHVRQLSEREILASGGLYQDQDLELVLTADYATGGTSLATLEPETNTQPQEIFFKVGDHWYKKVSQKVDSAHTYRLTLRKLGKVP
jgi:hypothetical protein